MLVSNDLTAATASFLQISADFLSADFLSRSEFIGAMIFSKSSSVATEWISCPHSGHFPPGWSLLLATFAQLSKESFILSYSE